MVVSAWLPLISLAISFGEPDVQDTPPYTYGDSTHTSGRNVVHWLGGGENRLTVLSKRTRLALRRTTQQEPEKFDMLTPTPERIQRLGVDICSLSTALEGGVLYQ